MALDPHDLLNAVAGPQDDTHATRDDTRIHEANTGVTDRNRSRDLQDTAVQQVTQLAIQRNRTAGFVDGTLAPLLLQASEEIWDRAYRRAKGSWLFPKMSSDEARRVADQETAETLERLAGAVSLTHRNLAGGQQLENMVYAELFDMARFGFRPGDPMPPGARHHEGGA